MKKSFALRNIKGFSLVEVLVFTAVLGLFFISAIAVATFNLKNMKIQEHKILAIRFAEEGIEWLKQEKEDDWSIFITRGSVTGTTYCLNNSLSWDSSSPCGNYGLSTIYKRELVIKNSGSPVDQVEAIITTYWQDMGTVLSLPIKTVFKLLE